MKKITAAILLLSVLPVFASCGRRVAGDTATEPTVLLTEPTVADFTSAPEAADGTTAATEEGETEDATARTAPAAAELKPGCFYGERTGTEKTFTGLEPLQPSDFPDAAFPASETFSTKTIEHSYGVAKDGSPHAISVSNQKFFDDGGYNALCLDTKTKEKILYLTFDCGYENGYTAKILDTLRDKNVPAAFFCTLPEMRENREIIARMINEGHIVGNHSVTHPNFANLSRREMYGEVKDFDDYLRENFGYSALYFRYPQGKYSEASLDLLNSMGYRCVFWSLAYADWDLNDQKGADYALQTVVSRLHPGAVMLLHAVSPDNANALGEIIDTARSMGYSFRALSDY